MTARRFSRSGSCVVRSVLLLVVVVWAGGVPVWAQSEEASFCREPSRRTATLDTRGLSVFYCSSHSGLNRSLRWAHASARPVFYGAVPLAWGTAWIQGDNDFAAAYRLTVAQGATYGLVLGLKRLVGRPRPFVRRALTSRSKHYGRTSGEQYQSFPSGHAALSATIVTSWGLSFPRWYVVAPGAMWAVGVSLSRLYLGVHYPSDVLAGAALGVVIGGVVHYARRSITPGVLAEGEGVPIGVRIRF